MAEERLKRPAVAALLSFVWPGLGQAYQRRSRHAALQALPQLVVVVAGVLALILVGPLVVGAYLFNPQVSIGFAIVLVFLGAWHAWSIADAIAWRSSLRAARAWATFLVALVFVVHAWLGMGLLAFYNTGSLIHQPPAVVALPSPGASVGATPIPGSTSTPNDPLPGADSRVTVLLVGVDNTHGDALALTDTLIVASYDPRDDSLVMISVPRDTARLPLYSGGTFMPRVNTLRQAATRDPVAFPDGPMGTLVNEMSYIVGVQIDYYAVIGISGFSQLIDAVGGVDIDVQRAVDDPGYQFSPTEIGFHVDVGLHHFDGKYGTAYARSRHGSSDDSRAARQQQMLLALRAKLNNPFVLTNLPQIVDAVGQILRTDAPLDRLPEIIAIAQNSTSAQTRHLVLDPPRYAHGVRSPDGEPTGMRELNLDAVAALSIELFGADSRYATFSDRE